jgi:predicted RNase H-like HicB family nuclease
VREVSFCPDEGRYYAEIPALPGCHTWGYSYEEAIQNVKEAAELWIEVKREAGEPIRLEAPAEIRKAKVTVGVLA